MKYLKLAFLLFVYTAYAQEIEVTPGLEAATVYRNSARLSYRTSVTLPEGNITLIFKDLSPYLIPESVVLKGVGKASIVNISYRNDFLINDRDNAKIQELKKQLHQTEQKLNVLEARKNSLQDELKILKSNSKLDKPNLSAVQQFINYYKKRYREVRKEIFDIDTKSAPLQKKAKKLKKQIQELQGRARRNAKDMLVTLSVPAPQKFTFRLEYITRNAGWKPSYNIRSQGAEKDLQWQFQAEVHQNTGIDWYNVPVTLSTLHPRYHMYIPEASPWYLHRYQPRAYAKQKRTHPTQQVVMTLEANEADEVAVQESVVVESDLDVQYTLKSKYTVLSGAEPVLVQLEAFLTPAEYQYYAVPYQNRTAFLTARVSDLPEKRLVPGKARIYYQDRYTGETFINPYTDKEHLLLALGNDPEIVIERKQTQNFKDYKSFGNKILVKRAYVITVKNNKKIPVKIEVRDRIPVSQDEKIEVKNVQISSGGKTDRNGIITWTLKLNPGETLKLKTYFEVKYPKDYHINL